MARASGIDADPLETAPVATEPTAAPVPGDAPNGAARPGASLPATPSEPAPLAAASARATLAGGISRRDLVLAGTVAGVTGLAAGIMRLPAFSPSGPATALRGAGEAAPGTFEARLFDSPPSYIASEEFPAYPKGSAPGSPVATPHVARGALLAERRLALFNENTGEAVSATYWADGDYVLEELESIHVLLRDHHAGEVRAMDLALVESLYTLGQTLETPKALHILSAYRTRRTNELLAESNHSVAINSFHIKGKAVDVRVPGRSKRQVLKAALALEAGGVGNYRSYVHLDTGPRRRWTG